MAIETADLVLKNGTIETMDEGERRVSALAVRNGRILAVGEAAEAAIGAGPGSSTWRAPS